MALIKRKTEKKIKKQIKKLVKKHGAEIATGLVTSIVASVVASDSNGTGESKKKGDRKDEVGAEKKSEGAKAEAQTSET